MNATVFKKNANDPMATDLPAQNSVSQPHGTQDQVNEMESEGQALETGPEIQPVTAPHAGDRSQKPDEQKGAVEGDHRSDKEPGNENAVGALDKNGRPKNKKAIAEDSIAARADETQG